MVGLSLVSYLDDDRYLLCTALVNLAESALCMMHAHVRFEDLALGGFKDYDLTFVTS